MMQISNVARLSCALAALVAAGTASAQMASATPQGPARPRVESAPVQHTPLDPTRGAHAWGTPGRRVDAGATGAPVDPNGPAASANGVAGNPPGGGLGGVADAGLTIIDFESLRHNDAGVNSHGYVYDEDGFELFHDFNEPFEFSTFGTQEARFPGSTALFNNTVGGVTFLYPLAGGTFSVAFIEVSNLNNNGPSTTTFTGHRFDGSTVTRTCTTSTDFNREETFVFSGFNDLSYVEWTQDSPFHQFDNIGVYRAPVVIDFQSLEHVDGNIVDHGASYYEDGFLVEQAPGEPFGLSTFGTLEARYPGSTALFDNSVGGVVTVTQYGGGSFNIHSIDLSNLNNNGPVSVTFVGTRVGGSTITRTFTTGGAPNGLETFQFQGFNNLTSLSWSQDNPFHQFDNLVLSRGTQVLDFLKLSVGDDAVHDWGDEYREDGFLITKAPGEGFGFSTFGTQEARFPGSTSLFNNTIDGLIHIDTIDNALFQLRAVDIAALNGNDTVTVNFVGHRHDGAVLNRTYTTLGLGQRLEVVTFNSDWFNLDDVEWTQDSPFHQFDNVTLSRQVTLIDFQKLEHVDGNVNDEGTVYQENGFRLTKGPGENFNFATFGTLEGRYPGSTALFNNTVGGLTHLEASDGGDFDLLQMDVAELNGGGPVSVTFVGTKTDGSNVVQSFTVFDPIILQTVEFTGFDDLQYVEWTQDSPFHQFDNIVVVEGAQTEECYPDCDNSGTLDLFDFLCFVNAFNANQGYANCDGNGSFDIFDFLCFVNAFNAGC